MKSGLKAFMQRIQKTIFWTILASETTHVFCCVLPTIVSIMSLLSGMGLIAVMPSGLEHFHDLMHGWELPIIMASGLLLALGWGLHAVSRRIDCRTDGDCRHEPCAPKKKHASRILMIATLLFVVNTAIYAFVHRTMDSGTISGGTTIIQQEEHHHG